MLCLGRDLRCGVSYVEFRIALIKELRLAPVCICPVLRPVYVQ